ncbi:MAG: hypothetical protein DHS20C13_14310 [Thermodesulfobacteriota bacterium]|nr:MAG: hypothetical protein DHS20C13_14310 [Thermodesulfobacteriota bacterium]
MKIKINPFKIAAYLEKRLGQEYVLAPRPDHPLLYSPPDLLIGGMGNTFAIFSPNANDIISPWNFSSRLILSKLVLPVHTKYVLLVPYMVSSDFTFFNRDFDRVFSDDEMPKLTDYIKKDDNTNLNMREFARFGKIKKQALDRFALLYEFSIKEKDHETQYDTISSTEEILNLLNHDFSKLKSENISYIAEYGGKKRTIRNDNLYLYNNSILANTKAKERQYFRTLSSLSDISINLNFVLDDGIPYHSNKFPFNFLFVDELPQNRNDTYKPLRAAAYAGWSVVVPNEAIDIENMISEFKINMEYRYHG